METIAGLCKTKCTPLIKRLKFSAMLAVMTGLVVAWEAQHFFQKDGPSIEAPRYLVALRDVPPGEEIIFQNFTAENRTANIPIHAFTDQDLPRLKHQRLARQISAGEILDRESILSSGDWMRQSLPEGSVAISVTPRSGLRFYPGDKVDAFLGGTDSVIESLPVLDWQENSGTTELALAVPKEKVSRFQTANNNGTLALALRSPQERKVKKSAGKKLPTRNRIEIRSEVP